METLAKTAFSPPSEDTDPVDDLQEFLEHSRRHIKRYSEKPDRNEAHLERLISEHEYLEKVFSKLENLQYYDVWRHCESEMQRAREFECDGISIHIPLVNRPVRWERMMRFDLTKRR